MTRWLFSVCVPAIKDDIPVAAYVKMGFLSSATPISDVLVVHNCFVYAVFVKSFIQKLPKNTDTILHKWHENEFYSWGFKVIFACDNIYVVEKLYCNNSWL